MGVTVSVGTPPGDPPSSQRVPAKTLSNDPPLSVVSVTTVPAGDVSVMSMSLARVCAMFVVTSTSPMFGARPDTTIVDVVTPLSASGVTGEFVGLPVTGAPQLAGRAGAEADAVALVRATAMQEAMSVSTLSTRGIVCPTYGASGGKSTRPAEQAGRSTPRAPYKQEVT